MVYLLLFSFLFYNHCFSLASPVMYPHINHLSHCIIILNIYYLCNLFYFCVLVLICIFELLYNYSCYYYMFPLTIFLFPIKPLWSYFYAFFFLSLCPLANGTFPHNTALLWLISFPWSSFPAFFSFSDFFVPIHC